MSLLNFPNSPATGDTYGFGVNIWEWTGSSWIKSGAITTTSGEDYTWTRPSDWLAMPSMTEGDQKVAALYAIYPGGSGASGVTASSNFFAFCVFGCTYTVDWGNGVTSSYTSGTTAQYAYDFAGVSSSTQTTEGFRQVIMQAYPSFAGTTFSRIDFNRRYFVPGVTLDAFNLIEPVLDLKICSNSITGITLRGKLGHLKNFEYVGQSNITDFSSFFNSVQTLENITGTEWTSKGITFSSMFSGLYQLQTTPPLNCSSGTNFGSMFSTCLGLKTIGLIDTSNGVTFSSMFNGCPALRTIPLINTSSGKNFQLMFNNCQALQTVPLLNTSQGEIFQSMFEFCYSLQEVPLFDLSKATNTIYMFKQCYSLDTVPNFNLESCTITGAMFQFCINLKTVPAFNTPKVQTFSQMFINCSGLHSVPLLNASQGTAISDMFQGCVSLKSAPLLNANATISYNGCNLSSAALNDIFTYLGVTGSGKTITITGNWGASGCNRSIATAKGWAVSG